MKQNIIIFSILLAFLFSLPSAMLLLVGMLPSMVAIFVSKGEVKARSLSVAFMNFAGCFPFLLKIWTSEFTIEKGIDLISDPFVIVFIYTSAGIGYVIDWGLSGYLQTFFYSRGHSRLRSIKKRQGDIVTRYGQEVTGKIPLDSEGFPINPKR